MFNTSKHAYTARNFVFPFIKIVYYRAMSMMRAVACMTVWLPWLLTVNLDSDRSLGVPPRLQNLRTTQVVMVIVHLRNVQYPQTIGFLDVPVT